MADIRTSFATAAAAAALEPDRFRPVGHSRWQGLLGDILDRYTKSGRSDRHRLWLWADLKDETAPHLQLDSPAESLRVLPMVLPESARVWFIAEDFARQKKVGAFWMFETDTDAVVRVLGEHHLFEYYIVDRHLEWMVGENHHDVLFAVGEPVASKLLAVRAARASDVKAPR